MDKRGIIKLWQKVISGCTQPSVQALVEERCDEVEALLFQLGEDFHITDGMSGKVNMTLPKRTLENVSVALSGDFQKLNAVLAVMAVTQFDPAVSDEAIRTGLTETRIAARMEVMQERPLVLLDGAHNPDKMRGAAQLMADTTAEQKVITVMGLKAGKDAADILPPVLAHSDLLITTSFGIKGLWEAVPAEDLATQVREIDGNKRVEVVTKPLDAVEVALEMAQPEDIVWITGSLYLAGDAREYWYSSRDLLHELEEARN